MTEHREATRYATPSLRCRAPGDWSIYTKPSNEYVGHIENSDAGWTAHTPTNLYAGLWPTKQAAAEVLVRQAGYEVGEL